MLAAVPSRSVDHRNIYHEKFASVYHNPCICADSQQFDHIYYIYPSKVGQQDETPTPSRGCEYSNK